MSRRFHELSLFVAVSLAATLTSVPALRAQDKTSVAPVQRGDIVVRVTERGFVQPTHVVDVTCSLPARSAEGFAASVKWIAEDGTVVKKGDKILEFDDTAMRQTLKDLQLALTLQRAGAQDTETELKLALLGMQREKLVAESNLEAAELELKNAIQNEALGRQLATIKVNQANVALQQAQLQAEKKKDAESKLVVEMAGLQRDAAKLELTRLAENEVLRKRLLERRIEDARLVLEGYKVYAERRRRQGELYLTLVRNNLERDTTRVNTLADELKRYVVVAPTDGLLVHFIPELNRAGLQQPPIFAGTVVRENQKLCRICDLSKMEVLVHVPEAKISAIRPGHAARVRIDAFPGQTFVGRVSSVSNLADVLDWEKADHKVYAVIVALEKPAAGLKPGMSAEATIVLGENKDVLRVPHSAVRRNPGGTYVCSVETGTGLENRAVVLGVSDGRFVEVKEGLKEGERVVVGDRGGSR